MQTYYMLGKYLPDSVRHISAIRTDECSKVIERLGGQIILMDALLGDYDLAIIVKFEDNARAIQASLALQRQTGITFKTLPAVGVQDFDHLAGEI